MKNHDVKDLLWRNSAVLENAAYVLERSGGSDVRQFTSCAPPPPLAHELSSCIAPAVRELTS
jgi:hypothetical protein